MSSSGDNLLKGMDRECDGMGNKADEGKGARGREEGGPWDPVTVGRQLKIWQKSANFSS